MSRYRRLKIEDGVFFYTLALADRVALGSLATFAFSFDEFVSMQQK